MWFRAKKKDKEKKLHVTEVECNVTEEKLTQVVNEVADTHFFVLVATLNTDDELLRFVSSSGIIYTYIINGVDTTDMMLEVDRDSFAGIAGLLEACDAELITIYFPTEAITLAQFIYNNGPFDRQQETVYRGLCPLICTWIIEQYSLYFYFDPRKYGIDFAERFRSPVIER